MKGQNLQRAYLQAKYSPGTSYDVEKSFPSYKKISTRHKTLIYIRKYEGLPYRALCYSSIKFVYEYNVLCWFIHLIFCVFLKHDLKFSQNIKEIVKVNFFHGDKQINNKCAVTR